MIRARKIVVVLLLLTMVAAAKRRDPLTDAEIEQLREAALQPNKRLRLFIKFADARLESMQKLQADPKATDGRGQKIHDLLEDFTAILDEINNNLDQYQGRPLVPDDRAEFRDGLRAFIAATDGFDLKLKTLHAAIQNEPQARKDAQDFHYVLQDAEDALKSSVDIAREYLQANPATKKSPDKKK